MNLTDYLFQFRASARRKGDSCSLPSEANRDGPPNAASSSRHKSNSIQQFLHSASLRSELQAWQACLEANHGRDPLGARTASLKAEGRTDATGGTGPESLGKWIFPNSVHKS